MSAVTELASELINVASITPNDENCQAILIQRLSQLGFTITELPQGKVSNFWAQRGDAKPLFAFAGHTDVVPAGNAEDWHTPPFVATEKDGFLHGRGAADMKGSLAAMVIACERFIAEHPNHQGSIGFLVTSAEEGDDYLDGTPVVMQHLLKHNNVMDYCIVGEPSSQTHTGDMIKVGRRGSLSGRLSVHGKQGHVAYPHLADNPIHTAARLQAALIAEHWDDGNAFFPATSLQITNIHGGTGAGNVIPANVVIDFNFRFSTEVTELELRDRVTSVADKHSSNYHIDWTLSGHPFLTEHGKLLPAITASIEEITQLTPELSTTGGTSDGRFIAPYDVEVVEFGPSNATIHQVDECIRIADLEILTDCYQRILSKLLT